MRICSSSEVTCSFPLRLNTADLHQQQLCDGCAPGALLGGELDAGAGGLEGRTDTPSQTVNSPGAVKHMQGHYFKVMHLRNAGHHCS